MRVRIDSWRQGIQPAKALQARELHLEPSYALLLSCDREQADSGNHSLVPPVSAPVYQPFLHHEPRREAELHHYPQVQRPIHKYKDEGIAGYVFPHAQCGTKPLDRLYQHQVPKGNVYPGRVYGGWRVTSDHLYTTNEGEAINAAAKFHYARERALLDMCSKSLVLLLYV
ncbi:hypothetical protein HGRIS_008548 [Hohenbuehelia grisea]|uniref:DUF5648 domain-containing protein n=1 Tax=Hohenbuehelia grisea TaxID=104357 RepID=A0ABR3J8L5_9AGAR